MVLWKEIIKPQELTEYGRLSLAEYEKRKGSLARWLPNRLVANITAKFFPGGAGLAPEAQFYAFDAASDIVDGEPKNEVTLTLPKLGGYTLLTEEEALRLRGAGNAAYETAILEATDRLMQGVSDRMERLRGSVLDTGRATINELAVGDDFGRKAEHNITVSQSWVNKAVSRFADLRNAQKVATKTNGEKPGSMVMNMETFFLLASGDEMKTQLLNGASRLPSEAEVNAFIAGQGLPPIFVHDRVTSGGQVIPDGVILFLPAPVAEDDYLGTKLGATFWGQTLESSEAAWEIAEEDRPGIVVATFRDEKPPIQTEAHAQAIGMPVLANSNLSLRLKVNP